MPPSINAAITLTIDELTPSEACSDYDLKRPRYEAFLLQKNIKALFVPFITREQRNRCGFSVFTLVQHLVNLLANGHFNPAALS